MYWVLYTSSIQHKDREHGEKGKLSPEIRHILALAPLSLQRTPQSSLCAGDGASLTPPAEAGSSGRRAGTSFMSELSAGNAPSLPGSPALPAAPSAALNKFSPLGEKRVQRDIFSYEESVSQPESDSLVSEDEDEEDDEEESEEELLALRRDGWVWVSAAGFSAGGRKQNNIKMCSEENKENYIMLHGCSFWSFFNTGTSLVGVDKSFTLQPWTTYVWSSSASFQSWADRWRPSAFSPAPSASPERALPATFQHCSYSLQTEDENINELENFNQRSTNPVLIHFLPNVLWGSLTVRLSGFLPQTRHDVSLQLPQRRRLQRLEVYLNLLGVGVSERRLTGLDDVNDTAELFAGQLVDVQAELALLVVRHRRRLLLFVWVKMAHEGIVGHLRDDVGLFGSVGGKQGVFNKIKMCTMQSTHKLSSRWQHSLALVVFLARCLLHRHHRAGHTLALRFWSFGHFRGLGRPDRCHILLYPPVLLFLNLFLLLFVLLVFLLLGFGDGALWECGELLMNSF